MYRNQFKRYIGSLKILTLVMILNGAQGNAEEGRLGGFLTLIDYEIIEGVEASGCQLAQLRVDSEIFDENSSVLKIRSNPSWNYLRDGSFEKAIDNIDNEYVSNNMIAVGVFAKNCFDILHIPHRKLRTGPVHIICSLSGEEVMLIHEDNLGKALYMKEVSRPWQ